MPGVPKASGEIEGLFLLLNMPKDSYAALQDKHSKSNESVHGTIKESQKDQGAGSAIINYWRADSPGIK